MTLSIDSVPPPGRMQILGSRIDRVTLTYVLSWALRQKPGFHQIITANTLMLLAAEKDTELRHAMDHAALVVAESSGVAWAGRWLGRSAGGFPDMIPGIDLMTALCALAEKHNLSVYFLGAKPEIADAAAQALLAHFPDLNIVGTRDGYFSSADESELFASIRNSAPDFLFVGMDMPRQEKWIAKYLPALAVPMVMGVGGSFDVLSGRLRRAPDWMRQAHLEWLFRLIQEPWRWRRIAQLPLFVLKVLVSR